ncbi:piggyBac transposable element-derived protein 2 [Trichonephila clavipes]|nr:piggyBac transposable element-derived protein 2 [Trichonephila clavipes]
MSQKKVFKTAKEAVEYLFSEELEPEMIALPPEVDELTDEEGFDDTETLDPSVRDVAGSIEISVPYENHDDHREADLSNKIKNEVAWNQDQIHLRKTYLEHILTETEKYAKQWKNKPDFSLTIEELKTFIGFLIFSGYHTLSSERDYWSDEEDLMVPIVKNSMTRNRYLEIKSMIHFADNNEAKSQANDRAFKIRKLITEMNANFQKWGIFDKHLSIDEMMIRYYGHHYFKQYIKGKPIRFGYKMWALCGNNGYCYNLDLYCGKEVVDAASIVVLSKEPLGTRVVKIMLQPVTDPKSHIVYFDNFFNSYNLLVDLRKSGFRATGTIRSDRIQHRPLEIDSIFKKTSCGSHDFNFDMKHKITAVKWNDNKCFTLATNFDIIEPLTSVSRREKRKAEKNIINQPCLVSNYNKNMSGVDSHDWLLEKHTIKICGKNGIRQFLPEL